MFCRIFLFETGELVRFTRSQKFCFNFTAKKLLEIKKSSRKKLHVSEIIFWSSRDSVIAYPQKHVQNGSWLIWKTSNFSYEGTQLENTISFSSGRTPKWISDKGKLGIKIQYSIHWKQEFSTYFTEALFYTTFCSWV